MSKQIPKSYLSVEQFLSLAIRFEVESAEYYHLMQKSADVLSDGMDWWMYTSTIFIASR